MELKFRVKWWLLIILVVVAHLQVSDGCLEDERLALLDIKAFYIPYPTNLSLDWVGANCCNWYGVTCNLTSGHVMELLFPSLFRRYMNQNYLLNVSLFQTFKQLKSLDLSNHRFIGFTENKGFNKFPSLNKLETLIIDDNNFGNDILLSLGGLTSLKKLGLSNNGLEGSLIGLQGLENLRELDLSWNKLKDTLQIQGLENLRELDLSWNKLNDTLQIQGLKELKRLEKLDLGSNRFNNSIFLSLSELTALKELVLFYNKLKGFIPTQDIAKLKSLEFLDVRYNQYNGGTIPFQDLKKLRRLDISYNQFNGSIQEFCEANDLVGLSIRNNNFRGQFSECVGNFSRLAYLDITHNQFSGKIHSTISNLTSIEYLSLGENDFEGHFSFSFLANYSKLRYFMLSGSDVGKIQVETEEPQWQPTFQLVFLSLRNCNLNKQTGSNIPSFLLSQHELVSISLSGNQLVGTFPLWLLHNNSNLISLDLRDNLFTGTLQLPIRKHKLVSLQISGNNFNGQLPNDVGLLQQVQYFNISRNGFEGNLPASMEQLKSLTVLDLSNNKFSGNLQISMFYNLFDLQWLFLANNNFSGIIGDGLKSTEHLVGMDISNNSITGKISSWIGSLKKLQYLQMSNNNFEGELPIEMCSLHQLQFLDISQNKLSGGVPSCFNSTSLVYLYLQKNYLSGQIPQTLSTASKLRVLDLSYNHLSGHIPSWLENFGSLWVLSLRGNELQGPIPQQLCHVREISILDLSSNKLNGSIPLCLNNITFGKVEVGIDHIMPYDNYFLTLSYETIPYNFALYVILENEVHLVPAQVLVNFTTKSRLEIYKGNVLRQMFGLDLSSNQLTGNIPLQIGGLVHIRSLNFSHNKLVGFIPKEISSLKQLESLDLSFNSLNGNIPYQLVGLDSLAIFNVSYNNLSGMIPTSPHFQTYPESSFYGNALCGPHIERKCLQPDDQSIDIGEEHEAIIDFGVFYWSFCTSYITILLEFVVVLFINIQWRQRWFYFIEDCCSYFCT